MCRYARYGSVSTIPIAGRYISVRTLAESGPSRLSRILRLSLGSNTWYQSSILGVSLPSIAVHHPSTAAQAIPTIA
ncbi:hypothetical protein GW17_00041062 [Ensete ventricosum]|nr:hypothetical protein GW17_00041062 [Ensete ventricosum]